MATNLIQLELTYVDDVEGGKDVMRVVVSTTEEKIWIGVGNGLDDEYGIRLNNEQVRHLRAFLTQHFLGVSGD